MSKIRIENLKVGMQIVEDIFSPYGGVLVNTGDTLDQRSIEKLKLNNVKVIKIKDEDAVFSKNIQTIDPEVLTQFSETYTNKTQEVKDIFDQFSNEDNTKEKLEENLTEITTNIITSIGTQKDILKYMSKMKETIPSLYTHCINVSILCNMFATLLDFPEEKKEELTLAALLHDIGKSELGIDFEYNTLNMEKLPPNISKKYKKHSILSYRILKEKGFSTNICMGVLMHHENVQGDGFPTGAKWNQIHEFAKILAIANYYDHITFSGKTRENINPFTVIKLLEEVQYNKFDFKFVNTFLKRIATYYQNEWVELTSQEIGQIVFINQNNLAHPIVKIGNVIVDLSQERDIEIARVL
ncbi:MAG: HD domain-containing protein [Halanaerobiales bacterium]|nr:HD domain-containing protein [Halanaerobiales bacterium]